MKRLLALLGAALMIAVAFFVRDQIDDDGTSAEGGGSGSGEDAVLVCSTELATPCRELARQRDDIVVRIEDAATTEALLVAAEPGGDVPFDAWLTLEPFPEMVAEERARALRQPVLGDPSPTLARSPLAIVVWNDRRDALAGACAGEITWRCIGDQAGRVWSEVGGVAAWGSVKPSHSPPDRTAEGLLVISQATASYLQRSDFSRNDFDGDVAFQRWFEQLERAIPSFPTPPRTPLDEMLSIGPAMYDLTGALEAVAGPAVRRSRDNERLTILYPSPAAVAGVVVVPVSDSNRGERVKRIVESTQMAELLAAAGWRVDGQPLADGVDASVELPADSGLPRAGVLEALRTLWVETVR